MGERLDFQAQLVADLRQLLDLGQRHLARERHARCPELGGRVSDGEYEELLDYADTLGIEDYFWQQGGAAKDSFIPAFDLTGVPR